MILINSSPKDALKIFQPFLPIFVPVGAGCVLAMAESRGIAAKLIDEQVEDDTLSKIDEYIREMEPPYVFGFSVLTAALKSAVETSLRLKERYPESIICFGGIHPSAAPEEVLLFPQVDYVYRGEGDRGFIDFYQAVKSGGDPATLSNISYRRKGGIVHNDCAPLIADLDSLPLFPYHRFISKRYDLGFVISSRGCPYGCIFCSNRVTTGKRYRIRAADSIIEEIELVQQKYNRRQILFLDDNLLVNRQRIELLIDKIHERGLDKKVTFSFQARGDNVDDKLLRDLYRAGFRSVFFGLETASERIMKSIRKGETVEQCKDAVRMAKKIGFHVSATFIYALPGETHEDRMDCVRLAGDLDLDMVRFNNATPYPGTELYEIAKRENRLNIKGLYENFVSVSTFIENPFREIPFSYVPEGETEAAIRRDILYSYFRYYLDVRRLKNIFARPDLGVGWFNAGEKLFDILRKMPALVFLTAMFFFKFCQFFYYAVVKKETALSLSFFLGIFRGLFGRRTAAYREPSSGKKD